MKILLQHIYKAIQYEIMVVYFYRCIVMGYTKA